VLAPRPVVDVPVTSSDPESAPNPADKVQPQQISIPALEVTMPVTPVGLDQDDLLEIPDPVGVAGWYRFSAVPGERDQAILMASHVSSLEEGFGPFSRLGELAIGDTVSVELSDGREVPFVISAREQLSKQVVDFAAITQDSAGMLVLVTCGGEFDYSAGHYDDNIIVWAAPTEVP
jgi:LPXTG-site transpeptidase (sortase) family protein